MGVISVVHLDATESDAYIFTAAAWHALGVGGEVIFKILQT